MTWNVEVWSIDIEAGGHWGVLLVLYLPVLWGNKEWAGHPEQAPLAPTLLAPGSHTDLVQVGEDKQTQLFAHVHGVHGKVILELGDRDEAVDLGKQRSNLRPCSPCGPSLLPAPALTFLSTSSLPCAARLLP